MIAKRPLKCKLFFLIRLAHMMAEIKREKRDTDISLQAGVNLLTNALTKRYVDTDVMSDFDETLELL